MAGPLNAKVVMSKCSRVKRAFGIRIEQRGRVWIGTWAFPLDERKAAREGFSAKGSASLSAFDDGYPGCPHCKDGSITQCACGKTSCGGGSFNRGNHTVQPCPWCGETLQVNFVDEIDVSGGSL